MPNNILAATLLSKATLSSDSGTTGILLHGIRIIKQFDARKRSWYSSQKETDQYMSLFLAQ